MWTLKHNGSEKPFAEWGIKGPVITFVSQAADVLEFTAKAAVDGDPAFPYKTQLTVFRQSDPDDPTTKAQYFVGWVSRKPVKGGPRGEYHAYQVSGPWWWFQRLVFQKQWFLAVDPADPESSLAGGYLSDVVLNQGVNGIKLNTAQQMEEIIQFLLTTAADQGVAAPMQSAGAFPAQDIPLDEKSGITCAEALALQLRWLPDAVTWFDYATSPPTFHCQRRGDMEAVPLTIGQQIQSIDLEPREDLRVPAVVLKYVRVNNTNGNGFREIVTDAWPVDATERTLDALIQTVNQLGFQSQVDRVDLRTRPFDLETLIYEQVPPADAPVGFANVTRIEFGSGEVFDFPGGLAAHLGFLWNQIFLGTGVIDLRNELMDGQVALWMSARAEEVTISGRFEYADNSNLPNVGQVNDHRQFSVRAILTNAETRVYQRVQSWAEGDPVPQGLARALFEALDELQYDGSIVLKQGEVAGASRPGKVVNVFGGRVEWQTMRAMVQQVTEELDTGAVQLTIGPAKHLGVDDLVQLLMVGRTRRVWAAPDTVHSGLAGPVREVPKRARNTGQHFVDFRRKQLVLAEDMPGAGGVFALARQDGARLRVIGSQRQPTAPRPEIDLNMEGDGRISVLGPLPAGGNRPEIELDVASLTILAGPSAKATFVQLTVTTPDGPKTLTVLGVIS